MLSLLTLSFLVYILLVLYWIMIDNVLLYLDDMQTDIADVQKKVKGFSFMVFDIDQTE